MDTRKKSKKEKLVIYNPHFGGGKKGEELHEQQQLVSYKQTQTIQLHD